MAAKAINLEDLLKRMSSLEEQIQEPNDAHLSFIPKPQKSNSLLMYSEPPMDKEMPTILIGNIASNYSRELWDTDVKNWKEHFPKQVCSEVMLMPLKQSPMILNNAEAIPKIQDVLKIINKLEDEKGIRVVCLGTSYSRFLYEGISYILKEWRGSDGKLRLKKHMEFITSGDTKNRDLSNFCQWLCISGTCQSITFQNTEMYHPFGICPSQYRERN